MNEGPFAKPLIGDFALCYGDYNALDFLCARYCAIRLACCVKSQEKNGSYYWDEGLYFSDTGRMYQ